MIDSTAVAQRPSAKPERAMTHAAWHARIGLLWMLFVPVCALFYTLASPLGANDFWYNARAGRVIWEAGAIPTTAGFSSASGFTSPQTPYYHQSWGSQLALFALLKFGSLSAVVIARSVLAALAFCLLLLAARRRLRRALPSSNDSTRARWACVGALLGFAMCALNLDTRPQMFSVPLFAIFVAALWEWPFATARGRFALGASLCALMIMWANTHGAFVTALMLTSAFAGGETLNALLARATKRENATENATVAKSLCTLFGVLALSACANPRGVGVFAYVLGMARYDIGRKHIAEWQPPRVSPEEWYNAVFFACLLLLPVGAWLCRRRNVKALRAGEVSALGLLAYLGCDMTRGVIWFALASIPALAVVGAGAFVSSQKRDETPIPRGAATVNAALALMLCLAPALALPSVKAGFDWPRAFQARFAPSPRGAFPLGFGSDPPLLLDKNTPVEAAAFLRISPPRGRLWNDMVFGSYLTWATAPHVLPSCDPRVELYPNAFWKEYAAVMSGPPDAAKRLQARGYTDALLDTTMQPKLIAQLKKSGWKTVFARRNAVLLRRAQGKGGAR